MTNTGCVVHWFRHGLRFHDNPALLHGLKLVDDNIKFLAVFIDDGHCAGLKNTGYNRARFLSESLEDLDDTLKKYKSQLYCFQGKPEEIFRILHKEIGIRRLTFEQDCEAIWNERDKVVNKMCQELNIDVVEEVAHTLWNPYDIIELNGGTPPLTYEMFLQVSSTAGKPPKPCSRPQWEIVNFQEINDQLALKLKMHPKVPTPEMFGVYREGGENMQYTGGETSALKHLKERLLVEENAFRDGYILPNQVNADILGAPMSMSAALRFGCLSVRKFYWSVQNTYEKLYAGESPPTYSLTAQLIWREFFYCMSVNNPKFDQMKDNPICIQIPWYDNKEHLKAWTDGQTGYPFIDACMRQLKREGWLHHIGRTAVSCFLTRGDLWISWEEGLKVFYKYLIDADWSVSAGNWMWVSSSAFERQLDCSTCICPVNYGRRVEPTGDYIRRFVPELSSIPLEYLFEPWLAPLRVQEQNGCIIGKDYPTRIVIHKNASKENRRMMQDISAKLEMATPHVCPSNNVETRTFLRLPDQCQHNVC
uniref:Cryptochrome-1 n=1 Tax=Euphausia superba TaxID=6819 RepID=A0A286Q179_EUPSU|nr:cryptochrome 1 [Euphausia superba]AUI80370.1 cryptochrome 1 [Euphausia superba]